MTKEERFYITKGPRYTPEQRERINAEFDRRAKEPVKAEALSYHGSYGDWLMAQVIADLDSDHKRLGKVYNTLKMARGMYTLNYHDGVKVYRDGSPVFDMSIQHNEKEHKRAIKDLESRGYTRQPFVW